jgi:hypothetical protein
VLVSISSWFISPCQSFGHVTKWTSVVGLFWSWTFCRMRICGIRWSFSKTIQHHIDILNYTSYGVSIHTLVVDFNSPASLSWNTFRKYGGTLFPLSILNMTSLTLEEYLTKVCASLLHTWLRVVCGQFLHVWWFCKRSQVGTNCWRILFWRSSSSNCCTFFKDYATQGPNCL